MNGKLIKSFISLTLCLCLIFSGIIKGQGSISAADTTTVYFLNSENWASCYAYVWYDGMTSEPLGGWPGAAMVAASEIGANWYKTTVPMASGYNIIVNNNSGTQYESYISTAYGTVYVTAANGGVYTSASDAEAAMGISGGTNEDPNPDLDYDIDLNGIGANLPYTTYEAEKAYTNATILPKSTTYISDIQSEASGRQAVKLTNTGDFIEFTLTEAANGMVLRYCIPDSTDGSGSNASLSLYINNSKTQTLSLSSKHSWIYGSYPYTNVPSQGKPHRFFDEIRTVLSSDALPAGTTIRLQKDASDTADYYIIDFIECEEIADAGTKPEGALSVTDYGAIANDGISDRDAFVNCISAAKNAGAKVWIPKGEFTFPDEIAFDVTDVTIMGAGMWHSILSGAGVSFHYQGTCKFYDFAMNGVSTIRDDSGDLAGFEGYGNATNVTIENIWMEHMKVGVWSNNTSNLIIQGCRIRNTYADGINLCTGTHNATVRNNSLRNTGDDCIAIWPWNSDCTNNTISNNTVQHPTLANGIAVYGGAGNVISNNYIADTINNGSGICIGSDYDTLVDYSGTTTVTNNTLVRCGSMHCDYNYPIGALWIWSTKNPMAAEYIISGNTLYDCSYEGILFDIWNTATGFTLSNNNVCGATDGIYIRGSQTGSATFDNIGVANYSGALIKNESSTFTYNEINKGVYETTVPETEEETTTVPEESTKNIEEESSDKNEETTKNLEEETSTTIPSLSISDDLEINGYQISTTLGGLRTIYSIEPTVLGKQYSEWGLVYGLASEVTAEQVYIGADSDYVKNFAATSEGVSAINYGSDTATSYIMTMTYDIASKNANLLNANYYVRAYAKLVDGTYVYSDISRYSVYSVADILYKDLYMKTLERHDYLYDNILSVVNREYVKVDFDWGSSIVLPK